MALWLLLIALNALSATRSDLLRGAYGPYRANNDLLFYHLDIRVDPEQKFLQGKNTIRFRMLKDGRRIQLDLHSALQVDKILLGTRPLRYQREAGAVFIDFPETLTAGKEYSIDFYYSGHPVETGRFGAITFRKDPQGHPWINTACEETGASVWWPNKDQWRDEVQSMEISVSIPNGLMDVSNGKFMGSTDLGDGYTRWDWLVHYPINNYDVSLNIGNYVHFSDQLGALPLDFYVLPEDKPKAEKQFAQAKGMLQIFGHYFGDYPFPLDGYKLIEVPYSGMEHQSAVTYGNHFTNGYLGRDWAGHGISLRFDFIIIHESAHEWFGNSITAAGPIRHVDPRGMGHLPRELVRGIALGSRRRAHLPERFKTQDQEPATDCLRARRQQQAPRRPVLQRRASFSIPCAAWSMMIRAGGRCCMASTSTSSIKTS